MQSILFQESSNELPFEQVAANRLAADAMIDQRDRFIDPITWSYLMASARLLMAGRDRKSKDQLHDLIYIARSKSSPVVCISGCRDIESDTLVEEAILEFKGCDIRILQGGATGIDSSAKRVAERLNIRCETEKAKWDRSLPHDHIDNKKQGPIRNEKMLGMSDVLIAFWDGKSTGTGGIIEKAISYGWVDVWEKMRPPLKWRVWLVKSVRAQQIRT